MRLPLIRSEQDDRPLSWLEWPFMPVVVVLVFNLLSVLSLLAIPVYSLYPEYQAHGYDSGTPRQQELMRRYRRFTSRVSFWRRFGRALTFPFRRKRARLRPGSFRHE